MFVKIHDSKNSKGKSSRKGGGKTDNKGSSQLLFEYLEKENEHKHPADQVPFFNHTNNIVSQQDGQQAIDRNVKNLGVKDSKFFMLTINPSSDELSHLIEQKTGKAGIHNFDALNRADQEKVFAALRSYTRSVMDIYAQNFNRENVRSGSDLVYFAKIETQRTWHFWEEEVKQGRAVTGEKKPGLNLHVHVVVSRNDITQTTKLSPHSRSRGGKQKFQGKDVEQGFNHEKFKQLCGASFCSSFNYIPKEKDTYTPRMSLQRDRSHPRVGLTVNTPTALPADQLLNKSKQAVKSIVLQGNFRQEQKILQATITAAKIITNPASAVDIARQKFLAILKGMATGNEI